MKNFKTFENFEPKRVKERVEEQLISIKQALNDAESKADEWNQVLKHIEKTKEQISLYVDIFKKYDKEERIKNVQILQQVNNLINSLDLKGSFTSDAYKLLIETKNSINMHNYSIIIENGLIKKIDNSQSVITFKSSKELDKDVTFYLFNSFKNVQIFYPSKYGSFGSKSNTLAEGVYNLSDDSKTTLISFKLLPKDFERMYKVFIEDPKIKILTSKNNPYIFSINSI